MMPKIRWGQYPAWDSDVVEEAAETAMTVICLKCHADPRVKPGCCECRIHADVGKRRVARTSRSTTLAGGEMQVKRK